MGMRERAGGGGVRAELSLGVVYEPVSARRVLGDG